MANIRVDGNDERGIDVAIMARAGFEIRSIRSHVDDEEGGSRIFSRDCPEFEVFRPNGNQTTVLMLSLIHI